MLRMCWRFQRRDPLRTLQDSRPRSRRGSPWRVASAALKCWMCTARRSIARLPQGRSRLDHATYRCNTTHDLLESEVTGAHEQSGTSSTSTVTKQTESVVAGHNLSLDPDFRCQISDLWAKIYPRTRFLVRFHISDVTCPDQAPSHGPPTSFAGWRITRQSAICNLLEHNAKRKQPGRFRSQFASSRCPWAVLLTSEEHT